MMDLQNGPTGVSSSGTQRIQPMSHLDRLLVTRQQVRHRVGTAYPSNAKARRCSRRAGCQEGKSQN